jgi:Uma2 family endonuclease
MTVAEFQQLPEPEAYYHELRHGELVKVTRPKLDHVIAQKRLLSMLDALDAGAAFTEFGFRPRPEYELRVADVALITKDRWATINPKDHFHGAPDVVIEVLSPSNTAAEMLEKEQICLENGCREFWIVDLDRRQVKVSTLDGRAATYKSGQMIPLLFAPGKVLAVDAIFA